MTVPVGLTINQLYDGFFFFFCIVFDISITLGGMCPLDFPLKNDLSGFQIKNSLFSFLLHLYKDQSRYMRMCHMCAFFFMFLMTVINLGR